MAHPDETPGASDIDIHRAETLEQPLPSLETTDSIGEEIETLLAAGEYMAKVAEDPKPGEIYLSDAMCARFGTSVGAELQIGDLTFTVRDERKPASKPGDIVGSKPVIVAEEHKAAVDEALRGLGLQIEAYTGKCFADGVLTLPEKNVLYMTGKMRKRMGVKLNDTIATADGDMLVQGAKYSAKDPMAFQDVLCHPEHAETVRALLRERLTNEAVAALDTPLDS